MKRGEHPLMSNSEKHKLPIRNKKGKRSENNSYNEN